MNRLLIARFGICLGVSLFLQANLLGQLKTDDEAIRQDVEDASMSYPAAYARMNRYLAVVRGDLDISEGPVSAMGDFSYAFAYVAGRTREEDKERVDSRQFLDISDGQNQRNDERHLKIKGHHWIERYGSAQDCFGLKPEDRQSSIISWDPFSMPINYHATLKFRDATKYREVVNHMMPHNRMFDAKIDPLNRRVGYWKHGARQEMGYTEIVFDPKYENMPTQLQLRLLKPGVKQVDARDPKQSTYLYQQNETKWFRHPSGAMLPSEVRCLQFGDEPSGWKLSIEWWLNDQVPDALFTLDDLLKAHVRASELDRLIEEREEQIKLDKAPRKKP